ncbi:unnamed protein product [Fraxinus pennsylvanica]|uniref:Uncharacterized protein n=1 Tax=Fraxinus pennsylvanica TaxID=56036 RepID=A0AAD1ZM63_9LAMI|nr:unnamed protein product [Fraxinus pennsylvanica]
MAKFYATAAVLFILFTLTLARSPLKPLEKDGDITSESQSLSLDDESSVIHVPISKILNAGESNHPIEPDSLTVHSVPLDLATSRFRPINRRFYSRTKYPVHNCRHHYHLNRDDFFKMNSKERRERLEIPYGDDMLVSSGENSDFEEPPTSRGVRRIPGRWVRLHHQHQNQNDDEDGRVTRIVFKRKNVDRLNREKKWKKHFGGENERAKDEKKTKSNGLMKSMRKFLDLYF